MIVAAAYWKDNDLNDEDDADGDGDGDYDSVAESEELLDACQHSVIHWFIASSTILTLETNLYFCYINKKWENWII